jgi:hypothetical protein
MSLAIFTPASPMLFSISAMSGPRRVSSCSWSSEIADAAVTPGGACRC